MLKFKVKSLDDVPEESRGLYKQVGDWFILQVEGAVDPEVAAAELKQKVDEFRSNNNALKQQVEDQLKQIEAAGGADGLKRLQELQTKIEGDEVLKLFSEGKREEYDHRLTSRMQEKYTRELEARDKRIGEHEGEINRLKQEIQNRDISAAINSACDEARVDPAWRDAASLLVRQQIKYEDGKIIVIGDDGKEAFGPNAKPATVLDALEALRDKKQAMFLPSGGGGASGGGKGGGGAAANPWKRDTLNLTEQARILKENPDMAKRLRAEAGLS